MNIFPFAIMHQIRLELFLAALAQVESGDNPNKIGDNGKSFGTYQIQYNYYLDTERFHHYTWSQTKKNKAVQRAVMVCYWQRYCPDALLTNDFETLARVHNGGPQGAKKQATKPYWNKVKAEYNRQLSALYLQNSKKGESGVRSNSVNTGRGKVSKERGKTTRGTKTRTK